MKHPRWAFTLLFTVGLLAVTAGAWAFPNMIKSFQDLYGIKKASAIDTAKCALCHTSANKGDKLNPFGEATDHDRSASHPRRHHARACRRGPARAESRRK